MLLKIQGREYPFPDFSTITFREGSLIKKHTGLKMGQLAEAFEQGDTDGLLALLIVAKLRTDGGADIEKLLDIPLTELEVIEEDNDEEEAPLEEGEAEEEKA